MPLGKGIERKSTVNRIINGEVGEFYQWTDEEGNVMNVSDGGMIYVDGRYYWYGQKLRALPYAGEGRGGQTTVEGVVMYSSVDLYHWRYERVVLACSEDPDSLCFGPMRFERPKIVFNRKTGQYVLWCHYVKYPGDHGEQPGTAEAAVAVCDKVNGEYRLLKVCRPVDDRGLVRDSTVFQDIDGTAYFLYDRQVGQDRCLYIVKLTDDYLGFSGEYTRIEAAYWREAPCLVLYDGYYYMITSGLSGWAPNQAVYFRTGDLMGEWENMGDPCEDDLCGTTYGAQGTYIFRVENTDLCIFMAERHNTDDFEKCSYVWLPICFGADHTLKLTYRREWQQEDYR